MLSIERHCQILHHHINEILHALLSKVIKTNILVQSNRPLEFPVFFLSFYLRIGSDYGPEVCEPVVCADATTCSDCLAAQATSQVGCTWFADIGFCEDVS